MTKNADVNIEYAYRDAQPCYAHSYLLEPIKRLVREFDKDSKLLDLGCGNGALSFELSKLGFDVYALDSSKSGIEVARKEFPKVRFTLGDLEEPLVGHIYPAETFDIIVSTEVVEHIYNPRRLIYNVFQLLKPSGLFVLSTPYHGYLKNLVLAISGKMDDHFTALWDGGHIKFWSRDTISTLITEAGFPAPQFLGTGRLPYVWKSMVLSVRKPTAI